jgi:hypothetical protein
MSSSVGMSLLAKEFGIGFCRRRHLLAGQKTRIRCLIENLANCVTADGKRAGKVITEPS